MITDIYRIKTQNSIYEIQVKDDGGSRCRKDDDRWRIVKGDSSYLEKLYIGPSFDIPGVALTSRVQDYAHFVPSDVPKRTLEHQSGIPEFFGMLTDHLVEQVNGGTVMVAPKVEGCQVEGCNYGSNSGPSHDGARLCKSGSIASGGTRAHCSCDYCY